MAFRPTASVFANIAIRQRYGPFIGGRFVTGSGEPLKIVHHRIPVENPATGEILTTVTSASSQDISNAVESAHEVFKAGTWSKATAQHRSIVLSRLARRLEDNISDLALIESLQTGRTIREMKIQLGRLPEWLDYYAALIRTQQGFVAPTQGKLLNYVTRIPLGVVAQITPFNHPLLIAIKKIAPALAAGNSVIVKPSELAPVSVLEFAQLAIEAGVPPSVLNVLPGTGKSVGLELVSNPLVRKVDVTAGTSTGRDIGAIVGRNLASYTAELGGKAPILVLPDADIPSAVNGVAFSAFVASGQTCVSGTRLILHKSIYDQFMELLVKKVESITRRIGEPQNFKSMMGTVISSHHLERISATTSASTVASTPIKVRIGAQRLTGTSPLDGFDLSRGSFYAPTILEDVPVDHGLWTEEVFGPVLVVRSFETEEEGIALANACKYGLGAGLWTQDIGKAHRLADEIEAGLVWVNTHHRNDPSSPWGGMKESGIGRENGLEALHAYSQSKSTIVNIASTERTRDTDDWFAEDGAGGKRYG